MIINNTIKYNNLEKHISSYTNIKFKTINLKYISSYNNLFYLYKVKKIRSINKIYKDSTTITALEQIDKLFESRHLDTNKELDIYQNLTLLKYCNIFTNYISIYKYININSNKTLTSYSNISHIYKTSLISCPISLNDIKNINSYVYYIYKYSYNKTLNSYKSCLIALFYYFTGLYLAIFELYSYNNIKIMYSNLVIITTKLSNFVKLIRLNKLNLNFNFIENIKMLNIANNSLYLINNNTIEYEPYLISLTNYTMYITGVFAKLSFQNTLKTLKELILQEKIDWCVDTKSNLILSKLSPVGSGWYRYFIN
uniref:RpoC2a n=1 Tax=Babesia sp. Dunhuang TaxID=1164853 RepID=A0A411AD77_9APIC|nr:RpoC2a [Babesia sp. Xinjiang]QAX26992.1 RpoC2a [Babesia sp. Xinjiang]QAX27023.1 RpoC2a [Babesia sp. Dunhuang]